MGPRPAHSPLPGVSGGAFASIGATYLQQSRGQELKQSAATLLPYPSLRTERERKERAEKGGLGRGHGADLPDGVFVS